MSESLNVIFDLPRHGWLPIAIIAADQQISSAASYVPVDSFIQLIGVINVVGNGIDSDMVVFNEEPAQIELSLRHRDVCGELILARYENDKKNRRKHSPLFSIVINQLQFAWRFAAPFADWRRKSATKILSYLGVIRFRRGPQTIFQSS